MAEQILHTLGRRIAFLRKKKGMSQDDFAEVSGKMVNTISKIERGITDLRVSTLISIADALDVSVSDLFNENSPPFTGELFSNTLASIVMLLKSEDERTLQTVKKQVEALLELKHK